MTSQYTARPSGWPPYSTHTYSTAWWGGDAPGEAPVREGGREGRREENADGSKGINAKRKGSYEIASVREL